MKVVFIGSGNVATHLAMSLQAKGVTISQIYSRTASNAETLAEKLNTPFTSNILDLDRNADVYFYALKDSSFLSFLKKIKLPANSIHVHTAGSLPMNDFEGYAKKFGVFYPLQTFSKNKEVDFSQVPICIEASSSEVEKELLDLAHLLSSKTYIINSEQRKKLHLAAVFACNFSNYMFDIAAKILEDASIGFDILQPLIAETAEKIKTMNPYEAQTGPAVRFDEKTIGRHLTMLKKTPNLKDIYKLLSKSIYKRHKK